MSRTRDWDPGVRAQRCFREVTHACSNSTIGMQNVVKPTDAIIAKELQDKCRTFSTTCLAFVEFYLQPRFQRVSVGGRDKSTLKSGCRAVACSLGLGRPRDTRV